MNLRELLEKPSQMEFWSKPENLVNFLLIQAEFWYAGASPYPSEIGHILEKAGRDIEKVFEDAKNKT